MTGQNCWSRRIFPPHMYVDLRFHLSPSRCHTNMDSKLLQTIVLAQLSQRRSPGTVLSSRTAVDIFNLHNILTILHLPGYSGGDVVTHL